MASIIRRGDAWRAMIRRKGKSSQQTFDTEKEARAWAEKEEARIISAQPADKEERPNLRITTVADLFDRYAKEVSPDKRGAGVEIVRLRCLMPSFMMEVTTLTGPSMAQWRDRRLKEVSASTVNRELNLISAVLTIAIKEWGLPLPSNPVHLIQRPKMPRARERRVPDHERAVILEQLEWDGISTPLTIKQKVGWGFLFALDTMMRFSEITNLTWQHVHLDRKFCHLPQTKNGDARNVPLSTRAVALIRLLPERAPSQKVLAVNSGTFKQYFRKAKKAAGIKDLHFHDTRREAITQASKKITNVAELARATGHRGTKSLMVYYHPDVTDIADKLG